MKKLLLFALCFLSVLSGYSQSSEQVVKNYISTLNDFLMSPNNSSARQNLENTLAGCLIQDGIYIKYKGDVMIEDITSRDYVGIIAEVINSNRNNSYAKVSIACNLETSNGGKDVTAYLKYTGALSMNTVTVFRVESGRIKAMTNDYIKTKDWSAGRLPCSAPSPSPSLPFSITKCLVSNVDNNGDELPFDATHSQYLKPTIFYECTTSGEYDIYVKFYNADGNLKRNNDSPEEYSYKSTVSLSSGSGSKKLKGWGGKDPGHWKAGNYRFEFYYKGQLLLKHSFQVPDLPSDCMYRDENGVKIDICSEVSSETIQKFRSSNFSLCKNYITDYCKSNPGKYTIKSEMINADPCLVYLVLYSKSLSSQKEKQNWFDLYPKMDNSQRTRLYEILLNEAIKLFQIELKYKSQHYQQN